MPRLVPCALTALLLVLLSACNNAETASGKEGGDRQSAARVPARTARAPVVFVLGDSYTVGVRSVPPERTYAAETARLLGWQVVIAGQSGTGFVARARIGRAYSQSFDAELAWRPVPDMVVLAGGHNDVRHPPGEVGAAADRLLIKIRTKWPQTHLAMIGPMWGADPPSRALLTRDALRSVAVARQVPFVDPLEGRWITGNIRRGDGNARQFILGDGVHPNHAGNRLFADRLAAELRMLGLGHPVLGREAAPSPATPGP